LLITKDLSETARKVNQAEQRRQWVQQQRDQEKAKKDFDGWLLG
jgi:hypothetical protein